MLVLLMAKPSLYEVMKMYPLLNYASRHKDAWGSGGTVPRINLSTRSEWSALCPGPLWPCGQNSPLLIGYGAGWAIEPVWTRWWEEKFLAPSGNRTPYHPAHNLVTILTEMTLSTCSFLLGRTDGHMHMEITLPEACYSLAWQVF
jgi:hypothetical protein